MKYFSKNIFLAYLSLAAFAACDDIDMAERITEGKVEQHIVTAQEVTVEADGETFTYIDQHRLLIEDFTGWRCVNCPNMAAFLKNNIEDVYPSVVVSLHPASNSLSNTDRVASQFSLSCTLADEIANTLAGTAIASSMNLPTVSIDQLKYDGQILQSGDTATVYNNLRQIAYNQYIRYNVTNKVPLNIAINATKQSSGNYQISTLIALTADLTELHGPFFNGLSLCLQLWLLEDGIEAWQSTQTGVERNYINNNVLRTAINGNQGETISVAADNVVKKHTLSFEGTNYVPENCRVVAIVSDPATHEVLNCAEVEL